MAKPFTPNWTSKPGNTVKDILEARRNSMADLAIAMELRPRLVLVVGVSLIIDDYLAGRLPMMSGASKPLWIKKPSTSGAGLFP
jgi:hypothetical protein